MVGQEVFYECISIMHGKVVLSPEYFNEAISDLMVQTFSFLNQINRLLFCGTRGVVAMQRVQEQRPYLAFVSVLKNNFSYYCCSQVLVPTEESYTLRVYTPK